MPCAAMKAVDGVMTLSAAQALFFNQTALILSGLPNTTQYVTYPPMPKAGEVSQVTPQGSLFVEKALLPRCISSRQKV